MRNSQVDTDGGAASGHVNFIAGSKNPHRSHSIMTGKTEFTRAIRIFISGVIDAIVSVAGDNARIINPENTTRILDAGWLGKGWKSAHRNRIQAIPQGCLRLCSVRGVAEDADLRFGECFFRVGITWQSRQVVRITVSTAIFAEFTDRLAGTIPEQGGTEENKEQISFHCNLAFVGS